MPLRPGLFMLSEVSPPPRIGGDKAPQHRQPTDEELLDRLESTCFICESPLVRGVNDSNEHVFPQWLQTAFQIEDDILVRFDGSEIKYKDVLVPCCQTCNNNYLNKVEDRILPAVLEGGGYAAFSKLDRSDIALWACKIMFGLLILEVAPRHKKKKHLLPPTSPSSVLEHLRLTQMLLAGFRRRLYIDAPAFPMSIFVLPLKSGPISRQAFSFRDSPEWPPALALRLGTIGLVVTFEDFGYSQYWFQDTLTPIIEGHSLHPTQFAEVVARLLYFGGLGGFQISYSVIEGPTSSLLTLNPIPLEGYPEDQYHLSRMIAECTGLPLETIWDDAAVRPRSLLARGDTFLEMPFDENVFYPL